MGKGKYFAHHSGKDLDDAIRKIKDYPESKQFYKELDNRDKKISENTQRLTRVEKEATVYVPSIDSEGNLSWTNDKGRPNPESVNIKGPSGVSLGEIALEQELSETAGSENKVLSLKTASANFRDIRNHLIKDELISNVDAKGNGDKGIYKYFTAIKGHTYKIYLEKWNYTPSSDWMPIFTYGYTDMQDIDNDVHGYLNGSLAEEYDFVAPECKKGYVFFRASADTDVRISIVDVTESAHRDTISFTARCNGNGTIGVKKYFIGMKDHVYRLTLPRIFRKAVTDDRELLSVYSVKGEREQGEYAVYGRDELEQEHEFTIRNDSDMCYVFVRAEVGEQVEMIIDDVTNIEKALNHRPCMKSSQPYLIPWPDKNIKLNLDDLTISAGEGELELIYYYNKEVPIPAFNVSVYPTYEDGSPYETSVGYLSYIARTNMVMNLGLSGLFAEPSAVVMAIVRVRGRNVSLNPAPGFNYEVIGGGSSDTCYIEDVRRVRANQRKLMPGEAPVQKLFTVLHGSDFHNCATAITTGEAVRTLKPDVFINTGDTVFGKGEEAINNVLAGKEATGDVPYLMAIGNHDVWWQDERNHPTINDVYDKFIKPFVPSNQVYPSNSTYYYYDSPTYKIRIIVLNIYDKKNLWGGELDDNWCFYVSDAQIAWLKTTLENTPDGWAVIACGHQSTVDYGFDEDNKFTSKSLKTGLVPREKQKQCYAVFDLLQGFKNHSKGTTKANGGINKQIAYDFTSKKTTEVICYLAGHYHFDFIATPLEYDIKIVSVDCTLDSGICSDLLRNEMDVPYDKRNDVILNALVIDRENRLVYLSRVGCKEAVNCYRDFTSITY